MKAFKILVSKLLVGLAMIAFCGAESTGQLQILLKESGKPGVKIDVEFVNKSDKEIRIWRSDNSWGWENLAIVVVREKRAYYYHRKLNQPFTVNPLGAFPIPVGGKIRRTIDLGDRSWICSEAPLTELKSDDTVIATYTVEKSEESEQLKVWTGIASSIR